MQQSGANAGLHALTSRLFFACECYMGKWELQRWLLIACFAEMRALRGFFFSCVHVCFEGIIRRRCYLGGGKGKGKRTPKCWVEKLRATYAWEFVCTKLGDATRCCIALIWPTLSSDCVEFAPSLEPAEKTLPTCSYEASHLHCAATLLLPVAVANRMEAACTSSSRDFSSRWPLPPLPFFSIPRPDLTPFHQYLLWT